MCAALLAPCQQGIRAGSAMTVEALNAVQCEKGAGDDLRAFHRDHADRRMRAP